jgi:hypothetical protein
MSIIVCNMSNRTRTNELSCISRLFHDIRTQLHKLLNQRKLYYINRLAQHENQVCMAISLLNNIYTKLYQPNYVYHCM